MAKTKNSLENIENKLKDLKIELLTQNSKRKQIKKEIAKLLTLSNEKNKQKTMKTN